jgi:plastocyanin
MHTPRFLTPILTASTVCAALMVAGCTPKSAPPADATSTSSATSGATSAAVPSPAADAGRVAVSGPTGSIAGTISLTGKPPAKIEIDTSMDPACGLSHSPLSTEQYAVSNGKLGNVFVYVKSGPAAAMHAAPVSSAPVVLDQSGCRYTPHVIGVIAGGAVEFRNSDPTMHNVHTLPTNPGNQAIDISMGPRGAAQTKRMDAPEMMIPVRCNNHPWMNAFLNVAPTPFFQVTGPDGKFDLKGLPPGQYVLGAVQEKLGEKTIDVTVAADASAKADFNFAMAH